MILREIFNLVWINILENKRKVMLTSLGIIVGAATIVLVIAIGQGSQKDVEDQFKNLSAGAVEISYSSSTNSRGFGVMVMMGPGGGGSNRSGGNRGGGFPGGGMPGGFGGQTNIRSVELDEEDLEDILLFVPGIASGTISATGSASVMGGDLEESTTATVAAVKPEFQEVSNLSLAIGDFITDADDENVSKVAVIGYDLAVEIFGSPMEAFDSIIVIDGRNYTVAGVLQEMGTMASGINPDSSVFIPYSTGLKYVLGRNVQPTITVVAEDVGDVEEIVTNVGTVLNQSYPGATFNISDAGSKMEAATASTKTMTLLLVSMASIVFVVGGIGIMNVLFVTVKERTREIGILKALGCSRRDILLEFLAEANMISVFGGVVGVILSLLIMPVLEKFGIRAESSILGILLALLFAMVTGTVFGFYPAKQAASLIPIEALSEE